MFTSHYNPERCFSETRDGSFPVVVHGDWLPRHIAHRLHIVFATARNVWLALAVAARKDKFDVIICDQVRGCGVVMRCGEVGVWRWRRRPPPMRTSGHFFLRVVALSDDVEGPCAPLCLSTCACVHCAHVCIVHVCARALCMCTVLVL
jgi:hypothetical protein